MNFEEEVNKLAKEHQLFNYNRFNIFNVMFKPHDEKYLHSRFIAFLLDPNGSHRQGTLFLEHFLQVIGIANFSLDGVSVNPNEKERGEIYNIDILIRNSLNQAIIVENKFFAKDQTKPEEKDPYLKYQLTRYYHSLVIEPKDNMKYDVVKIIYLTIDSKNPEDLVDFPAEVEVLISNKDHLSDIAKWLDLCLNELNEDSNLTRSIQQYKQARFEFLNDVQLAMQLKDLTAEPKYFEAAKQFWFSETIDSSLKIIQNQFIHVKWHTVHEFYTKLAHQIQEEFNVKVTEVANNNITKITHENKAIRTTITFEINGILYYICNDKNGFSVGNHVEPITEKEFLFLNETAIYSYFNFTEKEVFELIQPEKTNELVDQIVNQLKHFVNK